MGRAGILVEGNMVLGAGHLLRPSYNLNMDLG